MLRVTALLLIGGLVGALLATLLVSGGRSGGNAGGNEERAPSPELVAAASPGPAARAAVGAPAQPSVAALQAELDQERRLRERAELELAALRARLADAARTRAAPEDEAAGEVASSEAGAEVDPSVQWIDEAVLLEAGFDPEELAELRGRFEAIELERLFLQDAATREGWRRRPRYREEMRRLNEQYLDIRSDVGDDVYDWLLYAAGRANRIQVGSVMLSSPAEEVGVVPGDVIVAYDGRRIFDTSELRFLTRGGDVGDTVPLDVERDGELVRYYLPRGPLGVRLSQQRMEPITTR